VTSNPPLKLLSVIIPARDEEGCMPPLVQGLLQRYGDRICQIIIVDDNSSDSTGRLADDLARHHEKITVIHRAPPAGVGYALREGFDAVSPEASHVLMMDGDFVANLSEVTDLLDKADEGYELVFGSRFCWAFGFYGYPYLKRICNRAFHFLTKHMLGIGVHDVSNNFKIIRKDVLAACEFHATDFAINAETGLYPLLVGASWCEVPVKWVTRDASMGSSKFQVFRIAKSYFEVLIRCRRKRAELGAHAAGK
jgi:glycosyltransferase involved in cell wall biosynthesis